MATVKSHYEKYLSNKDFIDNGITDKDKFLEWWITGVFYCAVHLLEMYIVNKSDDKKTASGSHSMREQYLREYNINNDVFCNYKQLYSYSKEARYECIKLDNDDANGAQICLDSITSYIKKEGLLKIATT